MTDNILAVIDSSKLSTQRKSCDLAFCEEAHARVDYIFDEYLFTRSQYGSRKEFAQGIKNDPLKKFLFMIDDGKPILDAVLKELKPHGATRRAKFQGEDVA